MPVYTAQKPRVVEAATPFEAQIWSDYANAPSPQLRAALFDHYLPLARRLSARHFRMEASNAVPADELFQLACVGLLEAIDRFKSDLGVPFRYFGSRRITGSILNGIARYSEINHQISFRKRVTRERIASLKEEKASETTFDAALDLLGGIAAGLAIGLILDKARSSEEESRDTAPNAYETTAWKQTLDMVMAEVRSLPERESAIMRFHYQEGLTFEQIGEVFGLTKGRISQLHKAAIALLRKRLLKTSPFRFEN